MAKKIFFLSFMIILLTQSLFSQFLHVGVNTFITPKIYMGFFEYKETDYVYYFSNEYNETIRFSGLEESESKGYYPYPDLYIRYDNKNHLFFKFDVFGFWFTNEAIYKNSIDFDQYTFVFNTYNEQENLGYNTLKMKWAFAGNSLSAGYIFLKSKALRPFIFGGLSTMYLLSLEQGPYYEDARQLRNDIIFSNLSTFKRTTFYAHAGAGIKYKALSIDVYYRNTIADADIYANNFFDVEDISLADRPNYDYFDSLNISLSLNIFSFNLSKNRLQF